MGKLGQLNPADIDRFHFTQQMIIHVTSKFFANHIRLFHISSLYPITLTCVFQSLATIFGARALVLELNTTTTSQSLQNCIMIDQKLNFISYFCILNFLFPTFSLICSQGKTFLCSLSLSERGISSQEGILNNGFPNCNNRIQVQRSKRFSLEIVPQKMPNEHGKRHENDHGC